MSKNEVRHETVKAEEAGARLDRWVKRRLDVTQGQVEKMLRTGQIRVDGAKAKSNTRLETGQDVRLPPVQKPAPKSDWGTEARETRNEDRDFLQDLILYEDDEMIAFDKPSGLAVQGGTKMLKHIDGMLGSLTSGDYRPKLVHRLDKDTSGVLVVAKHPASAARLGELFRGRELNKIYWAVTVGVPHPRAGQIRSWIAKQSAARFGDDREMMRAAKQGERDAKHAITDYVTVSTAGQRAAWVALKPLTGRTHQLRFHMQEIETSILGDRKYAGARDVPGGVGQGLHLHARTLIVPRPRGKPVTITAPLPQHMRQTFDTLGFHESEAGTDPMDLFL